MMILPLADALQNCLQNLTSRIAGVDNEQMTNRVIGMGAMASYGLTVIKEQFKTPSSSNMGNNGNSNSDNSSGGFKGLVSRAKAVVNPTMNLNSEKSYNGNVNPIRNVEPKGKNNEKNTINIPKANEENKNNLSKGNKIKSVATNIAKGTAKATTAYLDVGAKLVEGDFSSYSNKNNIRKKQNFQNTEYINKVEKVESDKFELQEAGDDNELEE